MENEEEIQESIGEWEPPPPPPWEPPPQPPWEPPPPPWEPPPPPQPPQAVTDVFQLPLVTSALLTNQIMSANAPLFINELRNQFPYQFSPSFYVHQLIQQDRELQVLWANQLKEIKDRHDFRNNSVPLARIKKIMKADEDVKMIAAETPVLFSRACEMFILELTHRSWSLAEHKNRMTLQKSDKNRMTLQKSDITSAIAKFPVFDFLVDIVPMEEEKDAEISPILEDEVLNESIPCFYDPSMYESLMMDMRRPEINVSRGLSFAQHQEEEEMECNSSTNSEERPERQP